MPRPERPLRADDGPIAEFAQELRDLREKAGSPKYLLMARRTGRSRTALAEAAGGDHLPSWDTVKAFVEACGADPLEWLPRWERARETIREHRASPVAAPAGPQPPTPPQESADDVAILLRLWQEQRDQARQSENHRAILSITIALICAVTGFASVGVGPVPVQVSLALVVVTLAFVGAMSSHKYYERHQMHMNEARRLRQQLDQLRPHLRIETTWISSRTEHAARYPRVYRLRLHHLWVIVHLVLALVGAVLLARVVLLRQP
ncbi:helix-turn-helix domain-containing protein [Verrucosispora sp. TAA-831]|uniref:helix-turn-helix domain-containing protein n=1 Tax=Verrucosispora sp. TAA-831 TaxID=3422227 RepID=UPI003D6DC4F3